MDHSIHIHFGRRSYIKTQTNQIWPAFLSSNKRRKEMITMLSTYTHKERNAPEMHPTERQFVLSSVIALFRFALTVLLLRNQHGLQISKNLRTTHRHADQRGHSDYHLLQFNTCNEDSSIHQNQKSKRHSHYRFAHSLLCGGCALKLSTAYGHKIYRSTQGNQNFTAP